MRRLLLIAALMLTAGTAMMLIAGTAMAQGQPLMPKPLADHAAKGAQVFYMGKYDVLDGWVLIRAGQPEFYYSTPNSQAIVMGLLFNNMGDMLTAGQMKAIPLDPQSGVIDMMASQFKDQTATGAADLTVPVQAAPLTQAAPVLPPEETTPAATTQAPAPAPESMPIFAPEPEWPAGPAGMPATTNAAAAANALPIPDTPAGMMYQEIQSAGSVTWGRVGTGPAIYAFIDPNCPHCQEFLRSYEPLVASGQLTVNVLPVGYNDTSLKQAAFVIGAGDGMSRLLEYAKGNKDALPAPEGMSTTAAERNLTLMRKWGLDATPFLVYRSGKNGEIRLVKGTPADQATLLQDLRGQ